MSKNRWKRFLPCAALLAALSPAPSDAETPAMEKKTGGVPLEAAHDVASCSPGGIAVAGFDLVTYRQPVGPLRGRAEFAADHDGLTYLFTSDEHRRLFLADPEYYLPAYSGWCATTLALGRLTCPDYENFKIERDRLLLFEVTGFTNGRSVWDTDPLSFREKADTNFEQLNPDP